VTLQEEVVQLRAENADLRELLVIQQERIAELEVQLKQKPPDPPAFVRPNRPKRQKPAGPRKKRASEHNTSRRRETPTRIERHALDRCPTCTCRLTGASIDYTREVVDIPPPPPVEITEHQVVKRWCPHCQAWHSPHLDLSGQVIGQGRIGVRIAGVVSYLRTSQRMTVRGIQAYLQTMHRLSISVGEIVELLHDTAHTLHAVVDGLKEQMRTSAVVHADETGWREDGRNGYAWVFATPGVHGVRYYEYDHSRGQAVAQRILARSEGQASTGCLVSDFYCGYNAYAGPQQRCWVHLLRDLHILKEEHPSDDAVLTWARGVRQLYDDAQTWLATPAQGAEAERKRLYSQLVTQAIGLGQQYARERKHPCNALAKRLLRHQDELFQFVVRDGVSADNNLAERAVRPVVVTRKISGGSRSPRGSATRMVLATLFGTWHVRGLNPLNECVRLLSRPLHATTQTALP